MQELKEKANKYAEENVINVLKEAFAKVYADGYRDGYKDREEEIPVDMRDGKTEYVDLGLPSETLWSTNYETRDDQVVFLPFKETMSYALPSEDQWKELMSVCRWSYRNVGNLLCEYKCIGPNGNSLSFFSQGMISADKKIYTKLLFFWLKDNGENVEKNSAFANLSDKRDPHTYMYIPETKLKKTFMGFKLPIRLVKNK